jgi:hypothetical protein
LDTDGFTSISVIDQNQGCPVGACGLHENPADESPAIRHGAIILIAKAEVFAYPGESKLSHGGKAPSAAEPSRRLRRYLVRPSKENDMAHPATKKRGGNPDVKHKSEKQKPKDAAERKLEQGLEESMAGSDPVSVTQPTKQDEKKED